MPELAADVLGHHPALLVDQRRTIELAPALVGDAEVESLDLPGVPVRAKLRRHCAGVGLGLRQGWEVDRLVVRCPGSIAEAEEELHHGRTSHGWFVDGNDANYLSVPGTSQKVV